MTNVFGAINHYAQLVIEGSTVPIIKIGTSGLHINIVGSNMN